MTGWFKRIFIVFTWAASDQLSKLRNTDRQALHVTNSLITQADIQNRMKRGCVLSSQFRKEGFFSWLELCSPLSSNLFDIYQNIDKVCWQLYLYPVTVRLQLTYPPLGAQYMNYIGSPTKFSTWYLLSSNLWMWTLAPYKYCVIHWTNFHTFHGKFCNFRFFLKEKLMLLHFLLLLQVSM